MKTIFVFNDCRPTDLTLRVTALGEDGQRVATVVFDALTERHFEFAFGLAHDLPAHIAPAVAAPLRATRRGIFAAYDRIYGTENWIPVLIPSPTECLAWRKAMSLYRDGSPVQEHPMPIFGNVALVRILDTVIGAPAAAAARTVH